MSLRPRRLRAARNDDWEAKQAMKTSIVWPGGAIALAVIVVLGTAVAEVRTWTSADGKFKVEAELLSVQEGKVSLRKADGTEVAVPLTKLSEADRQFVKGRAASDPADLPTADETKAGKKESRDDKSPGGKTSAKIAPVDVIREVAEKFYADLRTKERESAAATLTAEAQKLAKDKKSVLASLPSPDEDARALRIGRPKIVRTQAEVPVQVRFDGKYQKTLLHLRSEDDAWRVFALSVVVGKDEQTISFETPLLTGERQDPLVALIGQKMELEGVTIDGRRLNMADYQGKVVLVDFWATWCGPCREEIPNIMANWQKYHESGFEVIAISVDSDLNELRSFVAAERPPWIVIADRHPLNRNSMGNKYGISGIPAFVLIGADGKVATVHCRGERLGQALANLLPAKDKTASR
jgi:thiol-disulfide isomerase/thioredoxin